jgi:lipoprotein-anchoring transpeptidase ErfK/SrfK
MKPVFIAIALACATALSLPAAQAHATIETPEAKTEAAELAEQARKHMRKVFRKKQLDNGAFLWREGYESNPIDRVVIGLEDQMAYAYSGGELVAVSTISSGKAETPTPTGIFPVLEKRRKYFSRKYDNAPMPFMQRIDKWGIALHGGHLPGYPASHGCVRFPHGFAEKLFAATKVEGSVIYIGA